MRKCKSLFCLLVLLLCYAVLPTPASAKADSGKSDSKAEGYENVTQTWTETPGDPLSGKSDFYTRDLLYDKATNKQFITVQGRDGNVFYIVIDYDAQVDDDEEKYMVYFLNQVDEADVSALVKAEDKPPAVCSCKEKCTAGAVNTSCEVCAVNMSECAGKEPEPEPAPEPDTSEPEKEAGTVSAGPIVVTLVMVLAGAVAACYLKFFKKKLDVSGTADLEDYDYGGEDRDGEDSENEPWEECTPEDEHPEDGES